MAWVYLFIAGLLEMVWAVGLKYTEGFTRLVPSVVTVGAMVASFSFLSQALKTLPVGTAYAVWTGIQRLSQRLSGDSVATVTEPTPRVFRYDRVQCLPDRFDERLLRARLRLSQQRLELAESLLDG